VNFVQLCVGLACGPSPTPLTQGATKASLTQSRTERTQSDTKQQFDNLVDLYDDKFARPPTATMNEHYGPPLARFRPNAAH
jgi:hypothetical protein